MYQIMAKAILTNIAGGIVHHLVFMMKKGTVKSIPIINLNIIVGSRISSLAAYF